MITPITRTAVQALVAYIISAIVANVSGLEFLSSATSQSVVVAVVLPLVVTAQIKLERRFPTLGSVLRSPDYNRSVGVASDEGVTS